MAHEDVFLTLRRSRRRGHQRRCGNGGGHHKCLDYGRHSFLPKFFVTIASGRSPRVSDNQNTNRKNLQPVAKCAKIFLLKSLQIRDKQPDLRI
jgi:hypothetical protein